MLVMRWKKVPLTSEGTDDDITAVGNEIVNDDGYMTGQRCLESLEVTRHRKIISPIISGLLRSHLFPATPSTTATLHSLLLSGDGSGDNLNPQDVETLVAAIRYGACRNVKHLSMTVGLNTTTSEVVSVMDKLKDGFCPHLECLSFASRGRNIDQREASQSIALALHSAHLQSLQSLALSISLGDMGCVTAVLSPLRECFCPDLSSLKLSGAYSTCGHPHVIVSPLCTLPLL